MFISSGQEEDIIVITHTSVSESVDLLSNPEDAETILILHACAALNVGANVIVVCSPDTDVLMLLLHH